ncbi:MAG: helix-turn-helix transcriptional regulator [Oscillospiraceae bacterium]|nr:helix-turn-helix transcriptional regulator [Oscillospiraceae bacterium]
MTYCQFGENLRKLRKGRSMTQSELGGQIGLSKAVISKYETGLGYPSFDVLIRIARFFGVTTDFLLGVAGSKSMDITGLTPSQAEAIRRMVAELRTANGTSTTA